MINIAATRKIEKVFLCLLKEEDLRQTICTDLNRFHKQDWQLFADLAVRSGVFPACYTKLLGLGFNSIPSESLSRFKNQYLFNLTRNMILEQELANILACLRQHSIPVISLKGPVLARSIHRDIALRQASVDLDLLVQAERLKEAKERLQETGYVYASYRDAEFSFDFNQQIILQKRPTGTIVDLHCNFTYKYISLPVGEFWRDTQYLQCNGFRAQVLSNENLLLYLAFTALHPTDNVGLKYLYDIHKLILLRGQELDWDTLKKKAGSLDLDAALFLALQLSHSLFNTPIVPESLNIKKPSLVKRNLLKLWLNKGSILRDRHKAIPGYTWRYLAASYLYSKNIFDCINKIFKRVFLPSQEVAGLYGRPAQDASFYLSLRRLLNPILKGKNTVER